jgi:phage minor structural protein
LLYDALIVRTLDGQEERLTDYTPPERKRRVNGDHILSFTLIETRQNQHSYSLCEEEAIIVLYSKGIMNEYKIKDVTENAPKRKRLDCVHIFHNDMINNWQYNKLNGYTNFVQALDHVFSSTSWEWVNQTATAATEFDNWGDDTSLSLLQTLLDRYKVEYEIDNEQKCVYFKTQIGKETDAQFRYGHNVKTFERKRSSKNLSTIIEGFGKDGLHVVYRSPNADVYGELPAKPIRDNRYASEETLLQACKDALMDTPEIQLKTDMVQLFKNGLPLHEYDVGDYIFAILDPVDVLVKVRVIEMTDYPLNRNIAPIVELSNFRNVKKKKGLSHIAASFQQTQKDVRDILDENGNIQLSVKKLYRNSNHYSDDTGDWFIAPDDPNAYVHIGAGGLDIHKGLVRIEREDGHAVIIGGTIQNGFNLIGAYPPFRTAGVEEIGPWVRVKTTNRFENIQSFTFKHDSRYLVAKIGIYTEGGITGNMAFDLDTSDGDGTSTENLAIVTRSGGDDGWVTYATMDLGTPDGSRKTLYVRLWGSDETQFTYGRILYISQEG